MTTRMEAVEHSLPTKKARPDQLKPRAKTIPWRRFLQITFAVINVWMCLRFYHFVQAARATAEGPLPTRPAGVEGWLPISGLMGAIDWIAHGTLNTVHPAATVLLLVFVVMALLFRKVFCSWLCPVGSLSEFLALIGRKLCKRNSLPPRWLDRSLMGIKYLLLTFFVWSFFLMGIEGISMFIRSPYNQVADVKMLLFFTEMGTVAAIVILGLAVGSMFIKGFWCRYFCPYGALLGLFSWMAPVKIRRNPVNCMDCGKCDKVCPSRLPIMIKNSIISVECTGCMECVEVCPVKDTLHLGTRSWKPTTRKLALLIAAVFLVFYVGARVTGHWQTSVTDEAYRHHISRLNSPEYGHPGR